MTDPTIQKVIYKDGPGISQRAETMIFRHFVLDQMASIAAQNAGVNRNTVNLRYRAYREAIYKASRRAPRFFGDVEMDVSYFGGGNRKLVRQALKKIEGLPHSEYVRKCKEIYARHRIRVFGILQRGGEVYVHIVRSESKSSLMPIIRLVVEQKSIIYTDKWRGFASLGADGYTHHSINHSKEYKDSKGHHANTIESFWSFCKRRMAKFNGIPRATLPLHLAECAFRWNHDDDLQSTLKSIIA